MDQASVLGYRRMRLRSNRLSGGFACFIPFASAKSAKGNVAVDAKKEQKEAVKREKISRLFEGEKKAKDRKGNAAATLDYLKLRVEAEALPKTSAMTKIKQKLHIGPKKDTKTSKVNEAQKKFIEGVLGRDPRLKKEKSGWRKAASVEGLHTVTGRVLSLVGGAGGLQMHTSLGKTLFHQGPGYGVQAPIAGWGRIASEIWQVQLNDGGKPKLPPTVQNAPGLKDVRKEFKDVKALLRTNNAALRNAIATASAKNASDEDSAALKALRDKTEQEKNKIDEANKKYTYRFAAFKRQYFGKRGSGGVSVIAGSVAAPLYPTVPVAGIAVQAATVPLQVVAGAFDYMKDKSYTLRTATKKVDISSLLKEESRNKPLSEIEENDIDITTASKFYEEQPQAILGVTREIYQHKLAELMYTQRKLTSEIEEDKFTIKFVPDKLTPGARFLPEGVRRHHLKEKEKKCAEIEERIKKLKKEIGHFERRETDQIDLDGPIGKALTSSWYFVKEGTSARCNNKVGEFWAQTLQRVSNNFQMLSSVGEVAILGDILGAEYGSKFVEHGLNSLEGDAPHDSATEGAAVAMLGGQVFSGLNAGITVIPARDYKDVVDRKQLAVPTWIKKGGKSGTTQEQLDDALKKGLLSKNQKKKIEKAYAKEQDVVLPGSKQQQKTAKTLKKWEEMKNQAEKIEADWMVNDIMGKDGKPILIDLRESAACYREHVSLAKRTWRVIKAIPGSMFSGPQLLLDGLKTKRARQRAREQVAESKELIDQADAILKQFPSNGEDEGYWSTRSDFEEDYSDARWSDSETDDTGLRYLKGMSAMDNILSAVASEGNPPSYLSALLTGTAQARLLEDFAQYSSATETWLEENNIGIATNNGKGMNCLIASLLQHATGRYEEEHEQETQYFRNELVKRFPNVGVADLLRAYSNEMEFLVEEINERRGISLAPVIVYPQLDGRPAAPIAEIEMDNGNHRVPILYGRGGLAHFEALSKIHEA